MTMFKSGRAKRMRYRIWYFILWPFVIVLVTQPFWQSPLDRWRCGRIAAELNRQYRLVVRYGDPSEFYVPPLPPTVNNLDEGYFIGRVDEGFALGALKGIRKALAK